MLLKHIGLKNFRQFYGEQEITISSDPQKNVTLIHAENGVGKTTFLNAVLWCFYKKTTARFENPEDILNHEAADEDNFEVGVEVLFEHKGEEYQVKRLLNKKYNDEDFTAFHVDNGNYVRIDNPISFIDSVVPQEMARYFFFDGEYAETFSSQNNKTAVRTAVESMLGCDTALTALRDLKILHGSLEKEISNLTKDSQSSIWQEKINSLQSENDKDKAEVHGHEINLATAEEAQNAIIDGLRNSEGAKEIQAKRDKLVIQQAKLLKKKNKLDGQIVSWINLDSVGLISGKALDSAQEVIKHAHITGLMPSRIAENFVNQIIANQDCICGRHFEPNSSEEQNIKALLTDAGTSTVNDRLMHIRTMIKILTTLKEKALERFSIIQVELNGVKEELSQTEQEINECSLQLKGSDVSEIAEREKALESRNQEIKMLIEKITRLQTTCEIRENNINEARIKRDKILATNTAAQGLTRKKSLLDATIQKLSSELELYRVHSRESLVQKVDEILRKAARRDYYVKIDDQFNLDMFYGATHRTVSKSSGENQLLSLAFISSLIDFASHRKEDTSHLLKPGTTAPLLLDSPFGQLDPSYRRSTAAFLPGLSEQVILLVSKSQGDSDVIEALGDTIGKEYVLISENRETQDAKPSDVLELKDLKINSSVYGCSKTLTRIQKVA